MQLNQNFLYFILVLNLISGASQASSVLTYQGRIVRPDGSALNSPTVTLTVQIKSPGAENCLMFQETHLLNMASTDGAAIRPTTS